MSAEESGQKRDGTQCDPGFGLGLPIAHDLAQLYGGALGLEERAQGGLAARLSLPATA